MRDSTLSLHRQSRISTPDRGARIAEGSSTTLCVSAKKEIGAKLQSIEGTNKSLEPSALMIPWMESGTKVKQRVEGFRRPAPCLAWPRGSKNGYI